MTALDYIILIVYFVGIVTYGLWVSRKIKSSDDYFIGDRKFKWWIMMGQAFSTGTHAEMPVAQTGVSFQLGFATIWYQWKNMLITPFYWLIGPFYRRGNHTTVGEIVEERYGRQMGLIYSIFAIFFFIFIMGAMLQGAAKVITLLTSGSISSTGVVILMTVAFIIYSFAGGLVASANTDFFQGILIIVLSVLLIPLGLKEVGGFTGMKETLPDDFFDLMNKASGIDGFTLAMLAVNGLVGITAQPHMVAMFGTGNTERAGRIGQTFGSLVKRLVTIGWALTGLIVAAMVIHSGTTLEDPEMAFGYGSRELLGPGLIGLMLAAIAAANMSSLSTFMVNNGALFTQNIYKEYFRPEAPDRELLRMGRYSGLVLALAAALFALSIENVLHAFLFTETIAAFVGIIFLGGFIWKRANRHGALAAILVSLFSYYWINHQETGEWLLVYNWKAAPFGWAMLLGFGAFFLISLMTKREDPARIESFFDQMRRQSDAGYTDLDGKAPLAAETGHDLILLDLPGWLHKERWENFFQRYREDLVGFVLSWAFLGLIILLAWAILQIGG